MAERGAFDLTRVSSDDLRAELARRKAAAKSGNKPLRFATKAEWARAKAVELRAALSGVDAGYQPGARGLVRKADSQDSIRQQIDKFEGLAAFYERKGL